jgi:hypothetical protein
MLNEAFAVLLTGHDYSLHPTPKAALEPRALFDLIDSIPMRQWATETEIPSNNQD